jgi:uroporphyrinogen decarboxylase
MRQAGRYQAEYRAIRARHSMLEVCKTPELAARVTLLPVEQFEVDAAILFADLLLPLEPMGHAFDFVEGDGPKIFDPVRDEADIDALRPIDVHHDLGYVLDAIGIVRRALDSRVPLIGFAGAPFTLASYLVEGGKSSSFATTKRLMYGEEKAWHRLCAKLADAVAAFLVAQIEAGAAAVQLFDSWAGQLSPQEYRTYVLPHAARILDAIRATGAPSIHFATGNPLLLPLLREAGADVVGVDWRIGLDDAWRSVGHDCAVQGNLDPTALFAPPEVLRAKVDDVLSRAGSRPGHIFNLGHGILPGTPPEHVALVADYVHTKTARPGDR